MPSSPTRLVRLAALAVAAVTLSASSWSSEVVDVGTGPGGVGFYNALAFEPVTGRPVIAYADDDRGHVKLARRGEGSWSFDVVDAGGKRTGLGNTASAIALAYNPQGHPAVSYGWGQLRLAEWADNRWNVQIIDKSGARPFVTSLVYENGEPLVAYRKEFRNNQGQLWLARRAGTSWVTEVVDAKTGGAWPSLAFDADGDLAVAYDGGGQLRLARKKAGAWQIEAIAAPASCGGCRASLALGPNGLAVADRPSGGAIRVFFQGEAGWLQESPAYGSEPHLAFDPASADAVVVFSSASSVHIARRTGPGTWDDMVYSDQGALAPGNPHIAFDPTTLQPRVSFYDQADSTRTLRFAAPSPAP